MAKSSMAHPEPARVVVGVDTYKDTHVARAKDHLGRRLGELIVPATTAGYSDLLAWAHSHGRVDAWGVEGTGSYGAGLARYLLARGEVVIEVIRPNRQHRRHHGKSDPADADAAASAVISGDARGLPKGGNGTVEMIRALRVARSTATKACTQASNACGRRPCAAGLADDQIELLGRPRAAEAAAGAVPGGPLRSGGGLRPGDAVPHSR